VTFTIEPAARLGRGRRHSSLDAVERQLTAADASSAVKGHPLPDLMGASPVEIAEALAAAIVAAHAEDWPSPLSDQSPVQLCPRCLACLNDAVTRRRRMIRPMDAVSSSRCSTTLSP